MSGPEACVRAWAGSGRARGGRGGGVGGGGAAATARLHKRVEGVGVAALAGPQVARAVELGPQQAAADGRHGAAELLNVCGGEDLR